MTLKIVALISGRGSNLQSLISHQSQSDAFRITRVLSDKPGAPGIQFAAQSGIPVTTWSVKELGSRKVLFERMATALETEQADLIVLAGFMRILPEEFIRRFENKILNIHPSLLPKFPGLDTHKRAIEAGEKKHGATVHLVDTGVDTGPRLAMISCEIKQNDSAETLAARVLSLEHRLYPWVLEQIACGKIKIKAGVEFSRELDSDTIPEGIALAACDRE